MLTTVEIDDDLLAAARSIAAERGISLGSVVSELTRRGLRSTVVDLDGDLPGFAVADGAPPITSEMVGAALGEF